VFTVDTAEHRLVLPAELPSREAGFAFRCRVTLLCRVAEPALVVAGGIRDIGATVHGPTRELLCAVAARYGAAPQPDEVEAALNRALRDLTGDAAIRLSEAHARLLPLVPPVPPVPPAVPESSSLRGEVLARTDAPPPARPSRVRGTAAPAAPSAPSATSPATPPVPRPSRVRGPGRPEGDEAAGAGRAEGGRWA